MRAAASAPAKAMLFGEYAVLEGHPAVALCFDARVRCAVRREAGAGLRVESPAVLEAPLELPGEALTADEPPHPVLRFLWPELRAAAQRAAGRLELRFEADLDPRWGLGSSSASTLAAVAALRALDGSELDPLALFAAVRDRQRAVQGAASGYDVATQLLGGCVRFAEGSRGPELRRLAVPGAPWPWLLAWTGEKVDTGAMIRSVRRDHPPGSPIYARIGALAEEVARRLEAGDREGVGRALLDGHELMDGLGAVPPESAAVIAALAADPAVLGVRLSGAGGGDCMVLLADDAEAAARAVAHHGLRVLPLAPTEQGLNVTRG